MRSSYSFIVYGGGSSRGGKAKPFFAVPLSKYACMKHATAAKEAEPKGSGHGRGRNGRNGGETRAERSVVVVVVVL